MIRSFANNRIITEWVLTTYSYYSCFFGVTTLFFVVLDTCY